MRSVAEVLKLVVESGHYGDEPPLDLEDKVSGYMCISLHMALRLGIITRKEYNEASGEIIKYLSQLGQKGDLGVLADALDYNSLDSSFEARKRIYLDWDNRPKPWKE